MQLHGVDKLAERAMDERKYPEPKRWGRRFLAALALLALLLVGGFWGWIVNGRGELDRQVAAYRAAGEPIEMGDFVVVGVADDDNAAVSLREAARLDEKSEIWKTYVGFTREFRLPLTDKEVAAIRDVVAANPAAFEQVDEAMKRNSLDWKIPFKSPAIQILLPDLHQQRVLARLMVHRAMLNDQRGDHAAAIADLRRAMFVGRAVGQQPVLIANLVSVGIASMTADALLEMSPGLKIGNGAGDARAADARDVSQLIAELLDDKPYGESYRRGLHGERAIQLDTARCLADGRLSLTQIAGPGAGPGAAPRANPLASAASFFARPMALADGLLMIRHTTALTRAYGASPNWPTYRSTAPPFPPEAEASKFRHLLARALLPSFERAAQVNFRGMAARRAAAIALAARRYALDHDGKLPAKLDDLAPNYLPSVPLDPFAAPPQPLKCINDPDKPIIYSVGEDGLDDGGSEMPAKKKTPNPGRWDKLDAVFPLKLQPRALPAEMEEDQPPATTPPTTAPAE
ncbi:MAG: hypothetical protein QOE14_84 [Humisphaera sp.]|nr:hypothetical protein [Humisphaera sp.]